jgi:hypothetical protein
MRGRFILNPSMPDEQAIWNNIVDEGENDFLQMIFQGNNTILAAGANFYVGLMGAVFSETTTLATVSGEPSGAGGYARQAIARNAGDWPTIGDVNGVKRILSKVVTFTATGADYSIAFSRMFLCNVSSGSAGRLFAVSGALPAPVSILNGQSKQMQYECYLR